MSTKPGRNDPCSCGSGNKYKNCCLHTPRSNNPATISQKEMAQATQMAWASFQVGKLEQAELLCHRLIQSFPNHADALHLLGIIALKEGNIELALNYLKKASGISNSNPMVYNNLGLAFHEQGKLREAEVNYRKAIALNSQYADAYYNLHALLLENPGQQAPIDYLHKLLAINSRDLDAQLMLGILLDRKGDAVSAQKHFEVIQNGPRLLQARLEAWEYIKANGGQTVPMLGSNIST
ncbi:MAG TPA: tetratricopeptide repeat protein, partial [Flavobacterium sp.]|nr:tetratricopeptide repeat protein [Flavobacterium sp.]